MGTEAFTEVQRRLRQRLVNAAEEMAREWFLDPDAQRKGDFSSQFSQLQYACASAACAEEIGCYVRYQIGRQVWPVKLGDRVLDRMKRVLEDTGVAEPAEQVDAWRLLATYLKRAYIYQRESRKADRAAAPERDRPEERAQRPEGPRPQQKDGPT
jgi:hypothetical protein